MFDRADLNFDFLPDDPHGIYVVGGTVRDLLLGKAPTDIDLAIRGDIMPIAATIARKCKGKIVDLGKKGFTVIRVAAPGLIVDITPLDGQTIEEDLNNRDFTINAMAYDVGTKRLVDCTGGQSDLRQKTIRMVSDTAFAKDPARLVRAYRMAATFHFNIAPPTRTAISRFAHLIGHVAGERVWADLLKLFAAPASAPLVRDMAVDGLLVSIFPELEPAIGCVQNRFHQFDVFEHSLKTYDQIERLLNDATNRFTTPTLADELAHLVQNGALIKYAALLHDSGKPATRKTHCDGRVGFPGHAARSAAIADSISRRLRLSNVQRETAVSMIRNHIRPLFLFLAMRNGTLGIRGTIRFFNHCKTLTVPILIHSMADIMAKNQTPQSRDADFIDFCDQLMADYGTFRDRQTAAPALINGHDLINIFGLFPAPRFKWILNRVDERRLSGELTTRDEALAWVKAQLAAQWGDGDETKAKPFS